MGAADSVIFEATEPADEGRAAAARSALQRVSDFHRRRELAVMVGDARPDLLSGNTRLGPLNPSLLQDLQRFDPRQAAGDGLDVLEVVAAALRHNRALRLHLQWQDRVIPLTVLPASRQMHATVPMPELLALRLPDLGVLRVEGTSGLDIAPAELQPLGPLLWTLALCGARSALLPEIAGPACYRATPGVEQGSLALTGSVAAAVARLRLHPVPLRELARWPGLDEERASRLLNGLYLQSALIVSRSHPGAVRGL
jgi:hypothetical protein